MAVTLKQFIATLELNESVFLTTVDPKLCSIESVVHLEPGDMITNNVMDALVIMPNIFFDLGSEVQIEILYDLIKNGAAALAIRVESGPGFLATRVLEVANKNFFHICYFPETVGSDEINEILYDGILSSYSEDVETVDISTLFGFSDILKSGLGDDAIHFPFTILISSTKNYISFPMDFQPELDLYELKELAEFEPYQFMDFDMAQVKKGEMDVLIGRLSDGKGGYDYFYIWGINASLSKDELLFLWYMIMKIRLSGDEILSTKLQIEKTKREFLYKLLYGDYHDVDVIKNKAKRLQIDLADQYVVALFEPVRNKAEHLVSFDKGDLNRLNVFFRHMERAYGVKSLLSRYNSIYFLIPIPEEADRQERLAKPKERQKYIKEMVGEIKRQLEVSLSNYLFSVGVGKDFAQLDILNFSYKDAEVALRIGQKVQGEGKAFYFCELGLYRLLTNSNIRLELTSIVEEYIFPILKYDEQNKTELFDTLQHYLSCGRNIRKCAEEMYLHHNTVRYRLEQINNLFNIDKDCPEDLLLAEIAIKSLPIVDEKKDVPSV